VLLKSGNDLARHLSRNQTLHIYAETNEELLMTILRNIQDAYDATGIVGAKERLAQEMTQPDRVMNIKVTRVLNMQRLVLCLVSDLLPLGEHYKGRVEFQAAWLSNNIGVVMGVGRSSNGLTLGLIETTQMHVMFIQQQVGLLKKFVSEDPFPHAAEVRSTLDHMDKVGPDGDPARKRATELQKQIVSAVPGDHSVFASVMNQINAFTSELFKHADDLGTWRDEYIAELYTYRQKMQELLRSVWLSKKMKSSGQSLKALEAAIVRIDVWLKPDKAANHLPFPFPTASILDCMWVALNAIIEGLREVSNIMSLHWGL
jgi:hypothetical protein